LARPGCDRDAPAEGGNGAFDDVHPDATPGDARHGLSRREAWQEKQIVDLASRYADELQACDEIVRSVDNAQRGSFGAPGRRGG
jgi:hypothetical protein